MVVVMEREGGIRGTSDDWDVEEDKEEDGKDQASIFEQE